MFAKKMWHLNKILWENLWWKPGHPLEILKSWRPLYFRVTPHQFNAINY